MALERKKVYIALLIAVAVVFLVPLASQSPDGLERVAIDKGFSDQAKEAGSQAPLAGYMFPGLDNSAFGQIAAGLIGVLVIVALFGVWERITRACRLQGQGKGGPQERKF